MPESGHMRPEKKMEFFKKVLSFFEALGAENFQVLLKESNLEKVKEFCKTLVTPKPESNSLPTEMKIGDRTYELLGFLKEGEKSIVGHEMVKRSKEMNAHLGQDDGQYLLDHQQDIPVSLRGKVAFVFTNWRRPDSSDDVCRVYWNDGRWVRGWLWLGRDYWNDDDRVLRRK